MYFIVDSSTTVGTAITDVNKSVVTIPDGFNVGSDEKNSVTLVGKTHGEKIHIRDYGKNDTAQKRFEDKLYELNSDSSMNVLSNSTLNISNFTVYQINFEDYSSENATNTSSNYVFTCNHTFLIKMSGYDDSNKLSKDLTFIIDTLKPDYKQSQD